MVLHTGGHVCRRMHAFSFKNHKITRNVVISTICGTQTPTGNRKVVGNTASPGSCRTSNVDFMSCTHTLPLGTPVWGVRPKPSRMQLLHATAKKLCCPYYLPQQQPYTLPKHTQHKGAPSPARLVLVIYNAFEFSVLRHHNCTTTLQNRWLEQHGTSSQQLTARNLCMSLYYRG